MMFKALVATSALSVAYGSMEIPEHARGGTAWKQYHAGLTTKEDVVSQTWNSPIDHFSNDNSTFQQRYYVNAEHWDGKGPVFLSIGGEGTLTSSSVTSGYMSTLGKNYSALLLSLEHRFYGESIPNGNALTENYQYLTVEQALADLATFTDFYKSQDENAANAKWFAFGGSYPGALASWYRMEYPDHTVGSLSSSGVVNCIVNFPEFDEQVSAAIGNRCSDQIKRINGAFERTIASGEEGWIKSVDMLHCEKDMWKEDFFYMIADSWSMADQYGAKTSLCSSIMAVGADASDEVLMQTFADFSFSYWGEDFCTGGFYNTEQLADPARWDVNSRSWRYQTCDQVSYFNTAPASGSLRSSVVDLDYHLKQCAYVFGKPMFPASQKLNEKMGGATPHAQRTFYSDFSDDPWQRASVNYPVSSDQPYGLAMCTDCGHCKDLHTPEESDPQPIKDLREDFEGYLWEWLQDVSA
jgi:hypothetical protein